MSVRLAVPLALSLLAQAMPAQAPPPPLSRTYVDALRDVLAMEDADAARLEQTVAAHPHDLYARARLMAYYHRADRASRPQDRVKRARHVLWLIEHHPDSEILHAPVAHFVTGEMSAADYQRAVQLWSVAAQTTPAAALLWNAASFFEGLDPALHLRYLEATAAADPNHPYALRPLADLYALTILQGGPLASRAQAGLDASKNVWVLGNAAYMFQSQYNLSVQRGSPTPRAAQLAEQYFLRARSLNPALDRNQILPQLPTQAAAKTQRVQPPSGEIRRLPIEAFPELPPAIAAVLRTRNCRVPQPAGAGGPRNVIRGAFFARGEEGWAVLCSAGGSTALLAFRNASDERPETLATGEEKHYLQDVGGGQMGDSREITPVGRDFIMKHYRAYGGPQPPPLDHQGIDDAFLEKASITWYFHNGKWLRLQGAD